MKAFIAFFILFRSVVPAIAVDTDDLAPFVARWGKPDLVESTERDHPRPPLVTRLLTYRTPTVSVRAAFLALAKVGAPPPYSAWRLLGFQNAKTDAVISTPTAEIILRSRYAPRR